MKNTPARFIDYINNDTLFILIILAFISTQLIALGALSYLGTFSRYLADDYCESAAVKDQSLTMAVVNRYVSGGSNRYSNLLFVGIVERFGKYNVQVLPFLIISIWMLGTIWVIHEFRKLAGIQWPLLMDILIGGLIVFLSAWQAPNQYQTFFWRSGMATHFTPIVFIFLQFGYIFHQINSAKRPSVWMCLLVFITSFLIGGFSEPPATFLVVMVTILMLYAWRWNDREKKRIALILLTSSLVGVLLALITMMFSPTLKSAGNGSIINSIFMSTRTFRFAIDFLGDTIRTKPLPTLVTFLTGFFIAFVFLAKSAGQPGVVLPKRQTWIAVVLVLLGLYILIAASFAPNAYGESYPAERAQFIGRLIMTMSIMLEGALLGILCAQSGIVTSRRQVFFLLGSLVLFILALYPLRAGLTLLAEIPEYRQWASTWDLRESEIQDSIVRGEKDLVVRYLPTRKGVKEIDATTKHWVNRCAANYYGVNSIRSVPMDNE